jgi:ankyrin repeat protein
VSAVAANDVSSLHRAVESMTRDRYGCAMFAIPPPPFQVAKPPLPDNNVTLMHIAAFFDALDCFIYLERKGLSYNQESAASYLPIHYACVNSSYEVVCYILACHRDQASILPSVEFHQIFLATVGGDPDILRLLFRCGADLSMPQNVKNAPVPMAIRKRNVDCLRILLRHKAQSLGRAGDDTALMLAIASNEPDAIQLLLESGEDPGFITQNNESALSLACFQGETWIDQVRMICDRVASIDLDPRVKEKAAIHWACASKSPAIVRMMLEKGIDVNRVDSKDKSGLFYLLDNCREETVIEIIDLMVAHGFKVSANPAALVDFLQAMTKQYKVIEKLLEYGVDPQTRVGAKKIAEVITAQARSSPQMRRIAERWVKGRR